MFIDEEGTRGKRSKIVDSIKLKVMAKMEDVTVQLENDVRSIAALEVTIDLSLMFCLC